MALILEPNLAILACLAQVAAGARWPLVEG
jgi:hypothetical protein